jgi:hypothetical protein
MKFRTTKVVITHVKLTFLRSFLHFFCYARQPFYPIKYKKNNDAVRYYFLLVLRMMLGRIFLTLGRRQSK